jgi:hypothetical protein
MNLFLSRVIVKILLLVTLSSLTYGQKKQLYFLADTINTNKLNRYFEISNEGKAIQYYMFYCKCIAPYKQNIIFIYRPNITKPMVSDKLPNYHYSSWMELSNLFSDKGKGFNDFFELFIVEALPNKKFMTNRVNLFIKKEQVVQ